MKKLFLLLFINLQADCVSAQQVDEHLQTLAKERIEEFNMYLNIIANKSGESETKKDIATTKALNLFIGKGDSYEYIDDCGNKRTHEPVKMQIYNQIRKSPPKQIKQYLKNLRYSAYKKVVIDMVDIIVLDNVFQRGDGSYEAIAHYRQRFCGYRDGRVIYQDVTDKKIKVFFDTIENAGQSVYIVLLGDIYGH